MSLNITKLKQLGRFFGKRAVEGFRWGTAGVAARFGVLAWFHLIVFSRHQLNEYRAVLYGGLRFRALNKPDEYNAYFVRRGTHRLEKGLIMRSRRSIFAQDYIVDLVRSFVSGCARGEITSEDRAWTESVLDSYFRTVESTPVISEARDLFYAEQDIGLKCMNKNPKPVRKYARDENSVSMLSRLVAGRRSVRWFRDVPVPNDIIHTAVSIAATAPSACNRQPYTFIVSHGSDAQEVGGYALGATALAHQFQCVIAVVGDLSAYASERDRHAIYIDGSLSAMQLILAFEALGLGSCVINWPDIPAKDNKIAAKLGLRSYQRTVMLVAVGYPVDEQLVPYSAKRPASSVIISSMESP